MRAQHLGFQDRAVLGRDRAGMRDRTRAQSADNLFTQAAHEKLGQGSTCDGIEVLSC
jgi:hypothetical protein